MAFLAGASALSSLKRTGSREMEAEPSVSSRLAYSDMPERAGGCGGGVAMLCGVGGFATSRKTAQMVLSWC